MPPKKTVTIALDGALTIQRAEDLYHEFLKKMDTPSHIKLDMSHVTSMDFAGLQVFYSLYRTLQESQRKLDIENLQPSVKEWFELSDFASILEKE